MFQSIRTEVLEHLVTARGHVDNVYHEMDGDALRDHLDTIIGRFQLYASDRDEAALRSFVRRWAAMRISAGAIHENLIPAFVAVGDELVKSAQAILGNKREVHDLMRDVVRANHIAARVIARMLADELTSRGERMLTMSQDTVIERD
jgi:hypothetical protein